MERDLGESRGVLVYCRCVEFRRANLPLTASLLLPAPEAFLAASAACCPPGSKKFAVAKCTLQLLGMALRPRAMPQMAVMWVSGPNT